MNYIIKIFALMIMIALWGGCGVKGKPQPPLTPPILGRGEMSFSSATKSLKLKKTPKSNQEPDWDESEDFPEDKGP